MMCSTSTDDPDIIDVIVEMKKMGVNGVEAAAVQRTAGGNGSSDGPEAAAVRVGLTKLPPLFPKLIYMAVS